RPRTAAHQRRKTIIATRIPDGAQPDMAEAIWTSPRNSPTRIARPGTNIAAADRATKPIAVWRAKPTKTWKAVAAHTRARVSPHNPGAKPRTRTSAKGLRTRAATTRNRGRHGAHARPGQ